MIFPLYFQNFLCIFQMICGGLITPQLVLKKIYSLCPCCTYTTFEIPPNLQVEHFLFSFHRTSGPTLQYVLVGPSKHCSICSYVLPNTAVCFGMSSPTLQYVLVCPTQHCSMFQQVLPNTEVCVSMSCPTQQIVL